MGMDCKYCGAYISSDVDKCPACGKRVGKPAANEYSYGYSGSASAQAYAEESENKTYTYKDEFAERYGTADYEAYGHENTTAQNFKSKSEEYKEKAKEYTEKAENFVRAAADDKAGQKKLLTYLSYFGVLFIIPYILHKDDEFCRFHANQGLLLFIVNTVLNIIGGVSGSLIGLAGWIFTIVCFIRGLRSVYRGTMEPLPLIGNIKLL